MEEVSVEIEMACTKLAYAYARLIDFRDYEGFAALFTEDGELDVGKPIHGADAIFEAISKRPQTLRRRHVISNVFVEALDPQTARGMNYLTLFRHIGDESLESGPVSFDQPAAVGHYEDRYALTPDGWRISRRKLHLAFRNENLL